MNPWLQIGIGWLTMIIVMTLLWFRQKSTHKSGIVDVAWPLGVAGLAVFFCIQSHDGLVARRLLIKSNERVKLKWKY